MRRECAGDATQLSLWRLLWRLYGGVWCLSGLMMLCSVTLHPAPRTLHPAPCTLTFLDR